MLLIIESVRHRQQDHRPDRSIRRLGRTVLSFGRDVPDRLSSASMTETGRGTTIGHQDNEAAEPRCLRPTGPWHSSPSDQTWARVRRLAPSLMKEKAVMATVRESVDGNPYA